MLSILVSSSEIGAPKSNDLHAATELVPGSSGARPQSFLNYCLASLECKGIVRHQDGKWMVSEAQSLKSQGICYMSF